MYFFACNKVVLNGMESDLGHMHLPLKRAQANSISQMAIGFFSSLTNCTEITFFLLLLFDSNIIKQQNVRVNLPALATIIGLPPFNLPDYNLLSPQLKG